MAVCMAVHVHVEVTDMSGSRRHEMIAAQRTVRDERKRRHHREGGCETSAQQMGGTNHPYT